MDHGLILLVKEGSGYLKFKMERFSRFWTILWNFTPISDMICLLSDIFILNSYSKQVTSRGWFGRKLFELMENDDRFRSLDFRNMLILERALNKQLSVFIWERLLIVYHL